MAEPGAGMNSASLLGFSPGVRLAVTSLVLVELDRRVKAGLVKEGVIKKSVAVRREEENIAAVGNFRERAMLCLCALTRMRSGERSAGRVFSIPFYA